MTSQWEGVEIIGDLMDASPVFWTLGSVYVSLGILKWQLKKVTEFVNLVAEFITLSSEIN